MPWKNLSHDPTCGSLCLVELHKCDNDMAQTVDKSLSKVIYIDFNAEQGIMTMTVPCRTYDYSDMTLVKLAHWSDLILKNDFKLLY